MNKSKSFAIIISVLFAGGSCVAYAQTSFDPPTIIVTKPVQPVSGIVPSGALHVPFTNVDLTARGTDIVVNDITVVQTGPADDRAVDEVLLLDSNGEVLGDGSLDDEHTIHFSDPIYLPRDTTLHLTVAVNTSDDLDEFDGQVLTFAVTSISASGYIAVK
ncbi:hypothetical protein HYT05_00020 [Candidatus Kaiserbacteria bacterium]|nr:hypothetical protein [Candidatus Kaiserbacteria bacterium]